MSSLQVFPNQIEFLEVELSVRYLMSLTIQNVSTSVIRYRIQPPKNRAFQIINAPTRLIAPGLELAIDIQFEAKSIDADTIDMLVVEATGARIEVPLLARVPSARLVFDNFVDLGPVVKLNRSAAYVDIVNEGPHLGSFEVTYDKQLPISISPTVGTIGACTDAVVNGPPSRPYTPNTDERPGSNESRRGAEFGSTGNRLRLKIEFEGSEDLGPFQAIANMKIKGQPDRIIDINANVVEHRLEFVLPDGGGIVDAIPFGSIYYGQERKITALLVNNGPKPASFTAELSIDGQSSNSTDDDDLDSCHGELPIQPDLSMTPSEGVVAPYSEAPFTFLYKPIKPKIPKGWSTIKPSLEPKKLSGTVKIESSCIDQSVTVDVTGLVAYPNVELSQRLFDFGQCPSGERVDVLMTIKNAGVLPAEYKISKVAHFSCRPNKGRLEPLQSQSIVVSFVPAQLGVFQSKLFLVVGEGLQKLTLKVQGTSEHSSKTKKKLVGGTQVIPQDFKPSLNFVSQEHINASKAKKLPFNRVAPWQQAINDGTATFDPEAFAAGNDTHLTFCIKELQEKDFHKQDYNRYLTDSRVRREKKVKGAYKKAQLKKGSVTLDPSHPANIGIDPQSGMEGPVPTLPTATEKLWLKSEARTAVAPRIHDETKLIKKKFKPSPVTQAERKDCTMQLGTDQLKKVIAGPRVINFQSVCVQSTSKRCFSVLNELSQAILVQIIIPNENEELESSSPQSQVVPAGTTAGFDIAFHSDVEMDYDQSFNYVINGIHTYKIGVVAEVVPISLELSKDLVEFSFGESNMSSSTSEKLMLRNPGNADAKYKCKLGANSSFTVEPSSGSIPPGQSKTLNLTFTPVHGRANKDTLGIHVDGGSPYQCMLFGTFHEPKCVLRDKKVDFGTVSVGVAKEVSVLLANTGNSPAVFYVQPLPEDLGITVSPLQGRIGACDQQPLELTTERSKPISFNDVPLKVKLRGGKELSTVLLGRTIIPPVSITQTIFDFGAVTIGVSTVLNMTIANDGPIPVTLTLDFSEHPEFHASIDSQQHESSLAVLQGISDSSNEDASAQEYCTKWTIAVPAAQQSTIELNFTPKTTNSLRFSLPISLEGVGVCDSIHREIMAEGSHPRLLLSKTTVDFGEKVVPKNVMRKTPHTLQLKLTNDDDDVLEWSIKAPMLVDLNLRGVFHIDPPSGRLSRGETFNVNVTFLPNAAKAFSIRLPIYLDNQSAREYMSLTLKGTGILPKLSFSQPEIVLPVVPLCVTSMAKFKIFNTGYDNLEIKYRLPVDTARVPIEINFPRGQNVDIANPEVDVEVRFSTKKPLCFTAKLEFYDNEGNPFYIPITGTSDNCLLTCFDFLSYHKKEFSIFSRKNAVPIQFMNRQASKALQKKLDTETPRAAKSKKHKTNTLVSLGLDSLGCASEDFCAIPEAVSPLSIQLLTKWINVNLIKTPVANIPHDFYHSMGKPIYDMIEISCAKQVPGRITKLSSNTKTQYSQLLAQYTELLRFLKSYGGMLNAVRPENLMDRDNYIRAKEEADVESGLASHLTSNGIAQRRSHYEDEWKTLSAFSWTSIIYQVIKIFVLFRITPKSLETLPGIALPPPSTVAAPTEKKQGTNRSKRKLKTAAEPETPKVVAKKLLDNAAIERMQQSNVYSASENVLLKWVSLHYEKACPTEDKEIVSFSSDLQDGAVLCALLASHVPSLTAPGRLLQSYHRIPEGEAQIKDNWKKLRAVLLHLGLDYGIEETELVRMEEREMLLFVLHLYNSLPQYIPKTTIEFVGTLGQVVKKSIEMRNPSKMPITYHVSLEGSSEFSITSSTLELEPLSAASFLIELRPRFTRSVDATLTFKSVKEGSASAATMVFALKSAIHTRQAIRTAKVETKTYEAVSVDLNVENQFPADGNYKVTIIQDEVQNERDSRKGGGRNGRKQPTVNATSLNEFVNNHQAFYCKQSTMQIKKGRTENLSVQFLPLKTGFYRCNVLLIDENVGEFMYEIHGDAELPNALDVIKFSSELKPMISKELTIPAKNISLHNALNTSIDRLGGTAKSKARDALKKFQSSLETTYKIEVNSPFYTTQAKVISVVSEESNVKGKDNITLGTPRNNDEAKNFIPIVFQPRDAGTYPCKLVLRSDFDTRVYEIEGLVAAPSVKTTLEFSAPARQTIVQEIPITNDSESSWSLRAAVSGSKSFFGPALLTVPPSQIASYPLTFKPSWISESSAVLTLTNATTGDKYEYELEGVGEEPLAEDNMTISCKSRDVIEQAFKVINISDHSNESINYKVESDLPHVKGASSVQLANGVATDYVLKFNPLIGGNYAGSITFTSPSGRYFWYTIDAVVESPEPEATLDVEANVRGAVAVEISLANPLNEPVTFDIELRGDGLIGDAEFELGSSQTSTYELIYSPLLQGSQSGAIIFSNDKVGEFWYRLSLKAHAAPSTILPEMCCAVGDVCSQPITLHNPTSEEITLVHSLDNRRNYSIRDPSVTLEAYGSSTVLLDYTPSSLSASEKAHVEFSHPQFGKWEYDVVGTGIKPSCMKETVVYASVGESSSSIFTFRNPFPKDLVVTVCIQSTSSEMNDDGIFKIMSKKKKAKLNGFGQFQIPIGFFPKSITEYRSNIFIENTGELNWNYPLVGISEAPLNPKIYSFACKARASCEKQLVLDLPGLDIQKSESFSHELIVPAEYERIVNRALVLSPICDTLTTTKKAIEYNVQFDPLKPFSCLLELVVKKKSGGQWRFQLSVEAADPDIDDLIVIESQLNQTSSVSFKLTNQFRERVSFHSELTASSSSAFTAFPSDGVLQPYGGEATNFVVSFTPTEYGKPLTGRLLITTDEMQWTFDLKGTHPEYQRPVARARVDSVLDPSIASRLGKKGSTYNSKTSIRR